MYSFGALLCEMCIRQEPDPEQRLVQVMQIERLKFRVLARRCLEKDPWLRPNMDTIIEELSPEVQQPDSVARTGRPAWN